MPVFLERFVLPLFAAGVVLLALSNPMGFDTTQRVTGALALILAAYFVGHTIHKSSSKSPAGPPATVSTQLNSGSQQERLAIISQLVEDYKATHNGEMPTFGYLNQKLQEQGRDFRITPPQSRGMTFRGGKFEGNGTAILNEDPNAKFTFNGTDFINNQRGIVNVPAPQQDGKPEPKKP